MPEDFLLVDIADDMLAGGKRDEAAPGGDENKEDEAEANAQVGAEAEAEAGGDAEAGAVENAPKEEEAEAAKQEENDAAGAKAKEKESWGDPILNYREKQRIWVKSETGKWRECAIIAEKRNKIRVHYLTYHRKYDEWLLTSSDRVSQTKPMGPPEEGDVLSTWSNKMKKWIVAEVNNIKARTNRIQLNLVGTDKQIWLMMDDKRISMTMKEPGLCFV